MTFPSHRPAALLLALTLAGCVSAPLQVVPPPALAQLTPWTVSGAQGWLPGRELRFGDYATRDLKTRTQGRTTPCPNGCSNTDLGVYKRRFDETFRTTTERTRYTLVDAAGAEADVQFVNRLDAQRREWVTRWFGLPTDVGADFSRQVSVIGTVQPAAPGQPGWRFALRDDARGLALQGWAVDDTGRRLVLVPLNRFKGRDGVTPHPMPAPGALGSAFELDGRVVAAVAMAGGLGTVWLPPDTAPELRLPLAGLISALLLRQSLQH